MEEKRHRVPPPKSKRARELRDNSSFPERLLWGRLRNGRLPGLKFRRQHVVGPYIADFYCAAVSLVIELDGRSHDDRIAHDRRRSAYLLEKVYRIVRYSNDDVLEDLDAIVEDILRQIQKLTPIPLPLREGDWGGYNRVSLLASGFAD